MSWNKNTVISSHIDAMIHVLEITRVPYNVSVFADARGFGLNDSGDTVYPLRRLQFGDRVFLEQMSRTCDCDADDTISSYEFTLADEPKQWPPEIEECVCGYNCIDYNVKEEE